MIELSDGALLVQRTDELPALEHAAEKFVDVETTSFRGTTDALYPWSGSRACGVAVAVDDDPRSWYVPIRHADERSNLPLEAVTRWLSGLLAAGDWVNHNVKFDAHFMKADGVEFGGRLVDTLTMAKLIDSDRGYGGRRYTLDDLSRDWLGVDIAEFEKRKDAYLTDKKAADFGAVPADVLGDYSCHDVLTARSLYRHMQREMPEQVLQVWGTEVSLTPVLYDVEEHGMAVDPQQLRIKELSLIAQLLALEEKLSESVGWAMAPNSNDDCFELLHNQHGLPVLARTDEGNPSYDSDALTAYMNTREVRENESLSAAISLMLKYRERSTLLSLFVQPYIRYGATGTLHPDYNQLVRTGRMSCSRPNAQQLSHEAKTLILARLGALLMSWDYSQVEFRLIVHYIQALDAIEAYLRDPDTDFHSWVAKMAGIPRRPAKNVNFAIGYGAGQRRVVSMLAAQPELTQALLLTVDEEVAAGRLDPSRRDAAFAQACQERGLQVYHQYHDALPTLRPTAASAERAARSRGYVFTAYGRRRHLPAKAAHRAFNTVIQGTAGDLMKERTVALAPRYCRESRDAGLRLEALVHDELLIEAPEESARDPRVIRHIASVLESPSVELRVPIRVSCKVAAGTWADASEDSAAVKVPRAERRKQA